MYMYYNITLNTPCFGPQATLIRESAKVIQHKTKLVLLFTPDVV